MGISVGNREGNEGGIAITFGGGDEIAYCDGEIFALYELPAVLGIRLADKG
jgi:hypothetical protein